MPEITSCTYEVKKTQPIGMFLSILTISVLLSFMTSQTWGMFIGISVLTGLVIIILRSMKYGNLGLFIQVISLVGITMLNFTVPRGYLMHTKDGIIQTKQLTFVSPRVHESPLEKVPAKAGKLHVKNEFPSKWSIVVWYYIPGREYLKTNDWILLRKAVHEGIEVPTTTLNSEDHVALFIEKNLKKQYPFMETYVEVTHK